MTNIFVVVIILPVTSLVKLKQLKKKIIFFHVNKMIKYQNVIQLKLISHNLQYILIRFLENTAFVFIQEN